MKHANLLITTAIAVPLLVACGTPVTPSVDMPEPPQVIDEVADATTDVANDVVKTTESTLDQATEIADQVVEKVSNEAQETMKNLSDSAEKIVDDVIQEVEKKAEIVVSDVTPTEPITQVAEYGDYAPIAVDGALAADKRVVLFFHASRCPSCRSAHKDLTKNITDLPNDVVVLKVDYDNSKDLKKKYGVTSQHTFVEIDADKNKIALLRGGNVAEIAKLFE